MGMQGRAPAALKTLARMTRPKGPTQRDRLGPTLEQSQKAEYVRGSSTTNQGQVNSVAYRRKPLFETLARSGLIDFAGLSALRYYRDRYERADGSLVRCALDIQEGRRGPCSAIPSGMSADFAVVACEAAVGSLVTTLRAVAIEDKSFSQVAIERFGSRKQSWIVQNGQRRRDRTGAPMVFEEKIVPKSGRHRDIISKEFTDAVRRLTAAHQKQTSTKADRRPLKVRSLIVGPAEAPAPGERNAPPQVDPAFLDDAGRMRPWSEIAEIIRDRMAGI
jgi:hypothetical protein